MATVPSGGVNLMALERIFVKICLQLRRVAADRGQIGGNRELQFDVGFVCRGWNASRLPARISFDIELSGCRGRICRSGASKYREYR